MMVGLLECWKSILLTKKMMMTTIRRLTRCERWHMHEHERGVWTVDDRSDRRTLPTQRYARGVSRGYTSGKSGNKDSSIQYCLPLDV